MVLFFAYYAIWLQIYCFFLTYANKKAFSCTKKRTPIGVQSNAHRMLIECSSYALYNVSPRYYPSLLSLAAFFCASINSCFT